MQRSVTVSVSQNDKKLSVKLSCTTFKVFYNSCNSDS